jgi:hypothetical protein
MRTFLLILLFIGLAVQPLLSNEPTKTTITKSPDGQFELIDDDASLRLRLSGRSKDILVSEAGDEYGADWSPDSRFLAVSIHYGRFAWGTELYRVTSAGGVPKLTRLKLPPITARVKEKLGVPAPAHNSLQASKWTSPNRLVIDAFGDDYRTEVAVTISKRDFVRIESIFHNQE